MRYRFAIAVSLLFWSFAASADDSAADLVAAYIEAWNSHDIELMMSMVADDVKWLEQADDEAITENTDRTQLDTIDGFIVRTKNREELAEAIASYFDSFRGTRTIIRSMQSSARTVRVLEEAVWDFAGVPMSQCATAVYFVEDGVITVVTYSREQPCDDESPSS